MRNRIDRSGALRLVLQDRPGGGEPVGVRAVEGHLPEVFKLPGESTPQFVERLRQIATGRGTVLARLTYADELR